MIAGCLRAFRAIRPTNVLAYISVLAYICLLNKQACGKLRYRLSGEISFGSLLYAVTLGTVKPPSGIRNMSRAIDIFFGPKAPAGEDSKWIPTDPARKFELMFRLYAPTKALFDKTWVLPDVEKVAA